MKYKLCWYCRKKTRDKGSNLFCPTCEKITNKEVIRSSYENAQSKDFGKGTKGLGI